MKYFYFFVLPLIIAEVVYASVVPIRAANEGLRKRLVVPALTDDQAVGDFVMYIAHSASKKTA